MKDTETSVTSNSFAGQPAMQSSPGPREFRAINVTVPAEVHQHARVAAERSGLSMKDYIARIVMSDDSCEYDGEKHHK